MSEDRDRRWRLALGGEDDALSQRDQRLSGVLTALYGEGDADEKKRKGGLGGSAPNVARWMSDIREYFPSPVVQIVQKDAFDASACSACCWNPNSSPRSKPTSTWSRP